MYVQLNTDVYDSYVFQFNNKDNTIHIIAMYINYYKMFVIITSHLAGPPPRWYFINFNTAPAQLQQVVLASHYSIKVTMFRKTFWSNPYVFIILLPNPTKALAYALHFAKILAMGPKRSGTKLYDIL